MTTDEKRMEMEFKVAALMYAVIWALTMGFFSVRVEHKITGRWMRIQGWG